jgi:hypothetical protein
MEMTHQVEQKVIDTLVTRFEYMIRTEAMRSSHTTVTIPEFLFGFPAFDVDVVTRGVKEEFIRGGFTVQDKIEDGALQHTLLISWEEAPKLVPAPANRTLRIEDNSGRSTGGGLGIIKIM